MRRSPIFPSAVAMAVLAAGSALGLGLAAGTTPAGAALPAPRITSPRAGSANAGPSAAQVRAAIRTATRSHSLWATINRCDTSADGVIGIRGEMPALDFPSHLSMIVTLDAWSPAQSRYIPVRGRWRLGGKVFDADHTVQNGISLRFPAAVTLVGHVTFEWVRNGKVLGMSTRVTQAGHRDDSGRPHGYSVGTCSLS